MAGVGDVELTVRCRRASAGLPVAAGRPIGEPGSRPPGPTPGHLQRAFYAACAGEARGFVLVTLGPSNDAFEEYQVH
jgi:hypothetical protein